MNHARRQLARDKSLSTDAEEPPAILAEREQMRLAMALGQLVHDRRMVLGLSDEELGDRLGMSADDVEHIEVGGVLPVTSELLFRLANALGVTVDVHLTPSSAAVTSGTLAA